MIDGKIGELRASFGEIGDQRLVVMAALTFADSLARGARRGCGRARADRGGRALATRRRRDALDALGARLEALAGQLAGGAEA